MHDHQRSVASRRDAVVGACAERTLYSLGKGTR